MITEICRLSTPGWGLPRAHRNTQGWRLSLRNRLLGDVSHMVQNTNKEIKSPKMLILLLFYAALRHLRPCR